MKGHYTDDHYFARQAPIFIGSFGTFTVISSSLPPSSPFWHYSPLSHPLRVDNPYHQLIIFWGAYAVDCGIPLSWTGNSPPLRPGRKAGELLEQVLSIPPPPHTPHDHCSACASSVVLSLDNACRWNTLFIDDDDRIRYHDAFSDAADTRYMSSHHFHVILTRAHSLHVST